MENQLVSFAAIFVWIAALAFFRLCRVWLPFYILGAVGLAAAIIHFGSTAWPLELALQSFSALHVNVLANIVGIPTQLFTGVPGAILVLVISQDIGWTVVKVDIECSGLIESAIFVGLLGFYPAWSVREKIILGAAGLSVTYLANLVRLLLIIAILHWGGKETLFIAHTVIGRALFFAVVALSYWYIITRPTIRLIGRDLRRGMSQ